MAFPENLKKEVRRRAGFQCCWCNQTGVEVHHITPIKDGGDDTIENAAPLCGHCHNLLGDNPSMRKQLREKRDWWYESVEVRFHPNEKQTEYLEEINTKIDSFRKEHTKDISEIKSALKQYSDYMIDSATPDTLITTASGIASTGFDQIVIKEPWIIAVDDDEGETT